MMTAYYLGVLTKGYAKEDFHEDSMENIDEIHFCINFDNKKTLGFQGHSQVKYVDVVSKGTK
jgi:hypothetical protein